MDKPSVFRVAALCGLVILATPTLGRGQGATAFEGTTLDVTSEWLGQDRGDGSGTYRLTTRVTDPAAGLTILHELVADRKVDQQVESSETLRVLEGDAERAHAGSDPSELGAWSNAAIAYAIPFDTGFDSEPRKTYRPRDKQVTELVRSAAPDAKVTTRASSDGRTTAVVEIPGVVPVSDLAHQFVEIHQAFREADVGLAKLQIKGRADTSVSGEAASAQ